jgi:hypothetical protein
MDEQGGERAESGAEKIGDPIVKVRATAVRGRQLVPFVRRAEQCDADDREKENLTTLPACGKDKRVHEQHATDGERGKVSGFVIGVEVQLLELVSGK